MKTLEAEWYNVIKVYKFTIIFCIIIFCESTDSMLVFAKHWDCGYVYAKCQATKNISFSFTWYMYLIRVTRFFVHCSQQFVHIFACGTHHHLYR